jgi:5-methylcytosine-specific restriction endonuclease McrA
LGLFPWGFCLKPTSFVFFQNLPLKSRLQVEIIKDRTVLDRSFTKESAAFNESRLTPQEDHGNGKRSQTPSGEGQSSGQHRGQNRALILNSSCQPVKLVSWQKALLLWFQGKVDILEYHGATVRSSRETFRLPSVLRLKKYIAPRRAIRLKFSRENIYLRDNYTCQYCGERLLARELTLDHVVPASKFGRKDWTNMVTACRDCNHRKANRTPIGAGMPLLTEPRMPNWLPTIRAEFIIENIPEEWRPYLGVG